MDIVYCIVKEFNKDISCVDQGYQAKINKMIQRYERSYPSLMILPQAAEQERLQSLERRCRSIESSLAAEQEKSQFLEATLASAQEKSQSIELALVSAQEKSQSIESALASEQEKSQSIESALASEQEKSRILEARCQTLESSLAAEQQRSQSRYQNHEERLKEVEDTVEQLWSISRDEVNLTNKIIGTGGWGYVTEANFRGRRVAAKCLHTAITSQHNQQLFAKEMKMFARCRHRNLLEFIGAVPDHPAIIVTELMDTNLREALSDERATQNHIHPICMDVAQALSYLHGIQPHPVIHRDVSAPNVLLKAVDKGGWIAKLSDLGSAQFANIAQTLAPGCVVYAAPEVRQESSARNQTTKMDVYSYGVLLIEILIRQMPLGNVADLITAIQPKWLSYVPLIRGCTTNEPSRRSTMIQVVNTLNTITI
ncbi:mitogen-activated protein kinase kinase kinase 7-like isoform X2 [Dysidea avara]|uniref:mitogen-activated protein kinase kinase kinase 7-like isoform X2 n=1 Tax=Dysidea avara TaxID=196820 RepID=UPI0033217637